MTGNQQNSTPNNLVIHSAQSRLLQPRKFLMESYRDLLQAQPTARRFFARSLNNRFRYSSLGLFWAFVPSAITALILSLGQRSQLLNAGDVPAAFYGVFGLLLAQTFIETLTSTQSFFTTHEQLLRRNNVPIEGLILASMTEFCFNTMVRIFILAVCFFVFGVAPSLLTLPIALLGFLGVLILGVGIGLILAPVSSLKRDISNAMTFLPWVLFATTPVFVAAKATSKLHLVYQWNPLAWIFDSVRTAAYGTSGSLLPALLILPVSLGILIFGWLACRLWRPYVMERTLV